MLVLMLRGMRSWSAHQLKVLLLLRHYGLQQLTWVKSSFGLRFVTRRPGQSQHRRYVQLKHLP